LKQILQNRPRYYRLDWDGFQVEGIRHAGLLRLGVPDRLEGQLLFDRIDRNWTDQSGCKQG
jgi:hypothetical protein